MNESDSDYRVAHFDRARVLFAAGHSHLAAETYRAFVDGLDRTHAFLALADAFPFANLFLVPSRAELDRFVAHLTATPTGPGRVGQAQGHDLYLLSPAAYPTDAAPAWLGPDGLRDAAMYARLVAHETVHMVEESLSPRPAMDRRPAWWSEGLAVLISNQHRLDRDVRDHMRDDLAAGVLPALDEMRGTAAYTWGWAAVDALRRTVGAERIASAITDTASVDMPGALGVEPERFDRAWRSHATAEARRILA